MFEKLITDFKKSLPESLRKKMGVDENSDEDQDFDEVETDSDDSLVENSEEEKKKKMKSMIIKVIVILGLGYFALDEFVLKDMQQSETDVLAEAPKAKRKKPVAVENEEVTNASPPADTDVSSETVSTAESNTESTSPEVSEVAPIENINVLEKTQETVTTEPVTEIEEQMPMQDQVISEARVAEPSADQKLDELVDNVEETAQTNPVEEIEIPSSGEKSEAPSMASKIVEGIIETPPPAYDQIGRGLVYNCKDKYWACLDKPAYVTCNKNQKWNKSKGNSAECVVADIYSSDEDCAKVQKFNVSTSASTSFCQK